MRKTMKMMAIALVVVLAAGAVSWAFMQWQFSEDSAEPMQTARSDETTVIDEPQNTSEPVEAETTSIQGSYIPLDDYTARTAEFADSTNVYFFHAPWCEVCQGIDAEITSDPDAIPDGITLIKTDFDTSTELRQKYGVTVQYTFVQVDDTGELVKKWNATSLAAVLAGIQS